MWRVCNFDKSGVFVRHRGARRGEDPCSLLAGGKKRGRESCEKFGESAVQTDRWRQQQQLGRGRWRGAAAVPRLGLLDK